MILCTFWPICHFYPIFGPFLAKWRTQISVMLFLKSIGVALDRVGGDQRRASFGDFFVIFGHFGSKKSLCGEKFEIVITFHHRGFTG